MHTVCDKIIAIEDSDHLHNYSIFYDCKHHSMYFSCSGNSSQHNTAPSLLDAVISRMDYVMDNKPHPHNNRNRINYISEANYSCDLGQLEVSFSFVRAYVPICHKKTKGVFEYINHQRSIEFQPMFS